HVLIDAAYVESPHGTGSGAREAAYMALAVYRWARGGRFLTALALEWPRVYASRIRAGFTAADPNDLLALAGVDAAVAALFPEAMTTSYAPSDWKGQMDKGPCGARVRSRLSSEELRIAEAGAAAAKSKAHNMWDAIGIGLHHLGRFAR